MISDADTNALEYAITDGRADILRDLVGRLEPAHLTELEVYGSATLLMHACERGTPEMVEILLNRGVGWHELEWSDNNELKAAVRNRHHGAAILPIVLQILPKDVVIDMITGDWDPDEKPSGQIKSALQLAKSQKDETCYQILRQTLEAHGKD